MKRCHTGAVITRALTDEDDTAHELLCATCMTVLAVVNAPRHELWADV